MSHRREGPLAPRDAPHSPLRAEIDEHIRARFPLLYLVSWEEQRMLRELESLAIAQRKRFQIWSQTEGLRNPALPSAPADPRSRDPLAMLDALLERSRPEILVALDLHAFLENHSVWRKLRDVGRELVKSGKTLIALGPRLVLPADLQKSFTVIDVPLPGRDELSEHLSSIEQRLEAAEGARSELRRLDREELVRSAQGMTLTELEQALALAQVRNGRLDRKAIPIVLKQKEQVLRSSSILEPLRWDEKLDTIGGLDTLKSFVTSRREAFGERARAFGLPAPKGICLIGIQGCGKSLTAKAVARLYRLPLVRLDMGRLFSGLVGSSEENARTALKLAESMAPCVLWIDEIDKGFAGTGSSDLSDGGTTARVIGTMTTWLQERASPVYVVATANDISRLPPELLRKGRFDELFFVDLPAPRERAEIFGIHLEKRQRQPTDFDLELLAEQCTGFSGAEIENAINAALFEAFNARRPLETMDIQRALKDTVPLSVMMREKTSRLRRWARGRARRASSVIDLELEIAEQEEVS